MMEMFFILIMIMVAQLYICQKIIEPYIQERYI